MTTLSRQLDRIAVVMSGICLAHCLMVPIVITLFPLLAIGLGVDGHFHALMLWLIIPVSVIGLVLGFRQHREQRILAVGVLAMGLLFFASLWGHDNLATTRELTLMIVASLALAAVHVVNFRRVRRCADRV